jgi:hypothetical protein
MIVVQMRDQRCVDRAQRFAEPARVTVHQPWDALSQEGIRHNTRPIDLDDGGCVAQELNA